MLILRCLKGSIRKSNTTKAEETAKQIEKKWVKGENVLCHFISNATLYDIGVSVAKLPYLAGREHDEFLYRISRSAGASAAYEQP